jgi:FtsP/CotA-like multicopper oxidase with cupredoxin domain
MFSRRSFLKAGALAGLGLSIPWQLNLQRAYARYLAQNSIDPTAIAKYQAPMVIPPAMPRTGKIRVRGGKNIDYYEIAVREFFQQILPPGMPATKVWSYGSLAAPGTVAQGGSFNYPAFTIEAKWDKPVRVRWINDLKDPATGSYLPHLLPVDQTLHWANPPGGDEMRDMRGMDPSPYTGPVPVVTHVHGAHTSQESDGYPEAWYLPAASNIPAGYAPTGTLYEPFRAMSPVGASWAPGSAVFEYPNDMRATTLWYHDHTLGMTRLNVYAGPAGFYLLRGGPGDGVTGVLPGPAPALGDPPGMVYYEIPIVIQDRSFQPDGSLFYPDNRAFFEGLDPEQLQIPFIPDEAVGGMSDISPIWNPEFFGNVMVVNGVSWPFLNVEQRRYRFRLLNGCNSRFLILKFSDPAVQVFQIGAEGGFLPAPVDINAVSSGMILMGPAERADVIVDFTAVPVGTPVTLLNLGPDEPFGGGVPGVNFDPADPQTTGQVMEFRVGPALSADLSTPPQNLTLPAHAPLPAPVLTRPVSLNEEDSKTVFITEDEDGNIVFDPYSITPFGPAAALLGDITGGVNTARLWMDPVTENPAVGATEVWEIHNFTMDAHPIHIHLVQFEVANREVADPAMSPHGAVAGLIPPEPTELGLKDTVIAYPGEITRVKATFDTAGLFVWHCHIVEHEDNEMMRPYRVG